MHQKQSPTLIELIKSKSGVVTQLVIRQKQSAKQSRADRLHDRVLPADWILAITAPAAQPDPSQHRHIIEPREFVITLGTRRRRGDNAEPKRHAVHHDIEKTTDASADNGKDYE